MSVEQLPDKKKRSLRPRFSLRLLFIVLTIIAVSLGVYVERVREQRAVVAQLRTLGATVRLSYETDAAQNASPPSAVPPGPAWARRWLGDDFFAHVTEVSFGARDVSEDQLGVLWKLGRLNYVSLERTDVSDDFVRSLQASFPNLLVRHRNSALLGVSLDGRKPSPCLVAGVLNGSAAAAAGLQRGDIVLAFQGAAIKDPDDLVLKVSRCWPEEKVILRIQRGDDILERTAILKRLPRLK